MAALRIFLLLLLGGLLLLAAIGDLRTRTIPNRLNALIAVLAPGYWLASDFAIWPDMALMLGVAFMLFLLFAGMFALGAMGGGDVKLIAALALWLPFPAVLTMLIAMALFGGLLTILILIEHRLRRRPLPPEVPYGVAIAAAGLLVMTNDILTSGVH